MALIEMLEAGDATNVRSKLRTDTLCAYAQIHKYVIYLMILQSALCVNIGIDKMTRHCVPMHDLLLRRQNFQVSPAHR